MFNRPLKSVSVERRDICREGSGITLPLPYAILLSDIRRFHFEAWFSLLDTSPSDKEIKLCLQRHITTMFHRNTRIFISRNGKDIGLNRDFDAIDQYAPSRYRKIRTPSLICSAPARAILRRKKVGLFKSDFVIVLSIRQPYWVFKIISLFGGNVKIHSASSSGTISRVMYDLRECLRV